MREPKKQPQGEHEHLLWFAFQAEVYQSKSRWPADAVTADELGQRLSANERLCILFAVLMTYRGVVSKIITALKRSRFKGHPRAFEVTGDMGKTASVILVVLMLNVPILDVKSATAESMTPWERATSTPKGELKNPYTDFESVAEEGHRIYMKAGCNGCHGGTGGGGMAAPLTNPRWVYGDDDDTLFRVIALGTGKDSPGNAFGKLGYERKGSETMEGPMPHFGEIVKTDDDLWKIIAWIRSIYCERRPSGC